jgi:putative flippase GtrA
MARLGELVRFGLVGGFNAGTYFGFYTAGVLLGVHYAAAALIAFVLSASIGYWLHEHWTFRGRRPSVRGWLGWLGTQAAGTALNVALLAVAVDVVGMDKIVAQAVLLPVTPIATYLVGRRWVFTRAEAVAAPHSGRGR